MGIAGRGAGEAEPSAALVASGVRQPVEVVDVQADVASGGGGLVARAGRAAQAFGGPATGHIGCGCRRRCRITEWCAQSPVGSQVTELCFTGNSIRRCPPLLLTHYVECVAILEPVAKVSYQCISVLYGEPGAVDMEGETCDPA